MFNGERDNLRLGHGIPREVSREVRKSPRGLLRG